MTTTTTTAITTDTPVGTRVRVSADATTTGGGYVDPTFKGTDTGTLDRPWRGSGDVVVRLEGHGVNYIGAEHVTVWAEEPAALLEHAEKVGRITIDRTDTGRSVWFYVVAALPDGHVYGVNLGTNSRYLSPDGDGFRYQTARVDGTTNDPLSTLSATMLEELASFLRPSSPVLADVVKRATEEHSGETLEEAYARGVTDGKISAGRDAEAWKIRATEIAHEYADRNDLCGEFDRCMVDIGLEPRSREYEVEVTLTYTTTVIASGRGSEDAAEQVAENVFDYVDLSSYGSFRDGVEVEIGDVDTVD